MTTLKFTTVDQHLVLKRQPVVASGDKNSVLIQIDLCSMWDGFDVKVAFYKDGNRDFVLDIPLENGACMVPPEMLNTPCVLNIGIWGKDAIGRYKTSTMVKYRVAEGTPIEAGVVLIDVSDGTAQEDQVLAGATFYAGDTTKKAGNVPTFEDGEPEYVLKGDPGESAYDTAVMLGFVGSEAEWIASLKAPAEDAAREARADEEHRALAETVRQDAEKTRVSNEAAREAAEQERRAISADILVRAEAALTSANEAKTDAENAAAAANTSEQNAKKSETAAAVSAGNAKDSETSAKASETNARNAESGANTAKTEAESAKASAENFANQAKTHAEGAMRSETAAANSVTSAQSSAQIATAKANDAATSATNASASETNAKNAESGAKSAQAAAEKARDDARDIVGGDFASNADVSNQIGAHNTNNTAHNDIRLLISGLAERLNTLANSDDTTLDQMAEVVAYIKSNRDLISQITTNKVNVGDIVNDLATNVSNKPLSAAQGVALKALIDAITIPVSSVNGKTGAVQLGAGDVGAFPTSGGTVSGDLFLGTGAIPSSNFGAVLGTDALRFFQLFCGEYYFANVDPNHNSPYKFGMYQWDDNLTFVTRWAEGNSFYKDAWQINGSTAVTNFTERPTVAGAGVALRNEIPSNKETWTFTLEDGTKVTKAVYIG